MRPKVCQLQLLQLRREFRARRRRPPVAGARDAQAAERGQRGGRGSERRPVQRVLFLELQARHARPAAAVARSSSSAAARFCSSAARRAAAAGFTTGAAAAARRGRECGGGVGIARDAQPLDPRRRGERRVGKRGLQRRGGAVERHRSSERFERVPGAQPAAAAADYGHRSKSDRRRRQLYGQRGRAVEAQERARNVARLDAAQVCRQLVGDADERLAGDAAVEERAPGCEVRHEQAPAGQREVGPAAGRGGGVGRRRGGRAACSRGGLKPGFGGAAARAAGGRRSWRAPGNRRVPPRRGAWAAWGGLRRVRMARVASSYHPPRLGILLHGRGRQGARHPAQCAAAALVLRASRLGAASSRPAAAALAEGTSLCWYMCRAPLSGVCAPRAWVGPPLLHGGVINCKISVELVTALKDRTRVAVSVTVCMDGKVPLLASNSSCTSLLEPSTHSKYRHACISPFNHRTSSLHRSRARPATRQPLHPAAQSRDTSHGRRTSSAAVP